MKTRYRHIHFEEDTGMEVEGKSHVVLPEQPRRVHPGHDHVVLAPLGLRG